MVIRRYWVPLNIVLNLEGAKKIACNNLSSHISSSQASRLRGATIEWMNSLSYRADVSEHGAIQAEINLWALSPFGPASKSTVLSFMCSKVLSRDMSESNMTISFESRGRS